MVQFFSESGKLKTSTPLSSLSLMLKALVFKQGNKKERKVLSLWKKVQLEHVKCRIPFKGEKRDRFKGFIDALIFN